jgi:hypothetical protein
MRRTRYGAEAAGFLFSLRAEPAAQD